MPLVADDKMYSCSRCKEVKERSAFYTRRHRGEDKPQGYCKPCMKAYTHANKAWDTHCRRDRYYLKKYGLTLKQYESVLADQGGVCAVCKKRKGKYRLHVDHCHTTGKIRGILCSWCNAGMGQFQDDPELLMKAIAYLQKHAA